MPLLWLTTAEDGVPASATSGVVRRLVGCGVVFFAPAAPHARGNDDSGATGLAVPELLFQNAPHYRSGVAGRRDADPVRFDGRPEK
jgi:hypothetical protein